MNVNKSWFLTINIIWSTIKVCSAVHLVNSTKTIRQPTMPIQYQKQNNESSSGFKSNLMSLIMLCRLWFSVKSLAVVYKTCMNVDLIFSVFFEEVFRLSCLLWLILLFLQHEFSSAFISFLYQSIFFHRYLPCLDFTHLLFYFSVNQIIILPIHIHFLKLL